MKQLITLLFLAVTTTILAQEIGLPTQLLVKEVKSTDAYIGTDAFGWEYTIADGEFRKAKDSRVLRYKALSLSDIYKVDIQNPLQIVLFYRKFNTVVLLDSQLNETSRISFSELQEPLIAEAAALASQNRLWIYDVTRQQIGLYDLTRNSFKTLTPPFPDPLKHYSSDYNYFYWVDAKNNCFTVNIFGKVSALGHLPAFEQVQLVSANTALLYRDGTIYAYSLADAALRPLVPVDKSFRSFHYAAQILSIFTGDKITQYQVTLP